ncbi:MAG: DUF2589 domain-containing protein [Sphaerochaetaceae bacterium]
MANEKTVEPTSEVAKQFQGLPMASLIGGPLTAVCDAQLALAEASYQYINKIGFGDDGKTTRLVEFDLNRPAETPQGYTSVQTHVQAPLLGLVPIPSLLVEDVTVEFQMEVNATTSEKSQVGSEVSSSTSANVKFGWFGSGSVSVEGKVSSSRENTRSTNQSAKYQVRVFAHQQAPTEGLSRLMDIMASCTAALPSTVK